MEVREYLKENILVFDGAMGTMLQSMGMKAGELPETLNINHGEKITEVHKKYIKAGAKVITSNTFGANELKLKNSGFEVEEVIDAAINNAKRAIGEKKIFIALDIGPIGELLEPMGSLSFEKAYEIFKRQVIQGEKSGAQIILIETMTDLYEAKAAVLAAKENSNLPIFCTMSFEKNGRTFTGCSAEAMIFTLQGLGVDALGVNCSLGPKEIEPILDEILRISKIPVMVQANAGLPKILNGKATFHVSSSEFAYYGKRFGEKGVNIIGGCCGTDDTYIKDLVKELSNVELKHRKAQSISAVSTSLETVYINGVRVIGERINPTGKKLFKEALKNEDIDYILDEAIAQVEAGADILDINIGLPEINQEELIVKVVKRIQSVLKVPLQIDSTNPKVIENFLRVYNGKAIVNSVNGEDETLDSILPIAKKYGASVVGLTLDNKGIPKDAEERFKIAEKIINRAKYYGIGKEDVYIDCLALTAAAQQKDVKETLKAITMVKEKLGVKTLLGISNVSFGLPNRSLMNRTFLALGLQAGVDLPIVNPLDKNVMETVRAFKVLSNEDIGAIDYINSNCENMKTLKEDFKEKEVSLYYLIRRGVIKGVKEATEKLLKEKNPLEIINEIIIPALDFVGEEYEKERVFLPQLIQSAEVVKCAFQIIKESLKGDEDSKMLKGKILLATVKGDIHDIGKNIVKLLLENYGYEVIDLGKDVTKEKILEVAMKENIKMIGLSALMTTTVENMEETIKYLKKSYSECKIMVGGAVLTEEYALTIGADFYAKDAKDSINIAKKVLG